MGIDSGTVLEEEHKQGRQRPLSEASRGHKRSQGQGSPCQPAKRPSGIIPLLSWFLTLAVQESHSLKTVQIHDPRHCFFSFTEYPNKQ